MIKNDQKQIIEEMVKDRKIRTAVTRKSHYWFFHFYFGHYIQYETANFQKEMFALTEDDKVKNMVVVAFRGSAKSTIMTMSYPIWAVLGRQQRKFVLILGLTQKQAKQHLVNLKRELESNRLLQQDLGPFEEDEEWGSYSLVIPKLNARITAASSEQSIRGIRHEQYRPDLIICDDVEDLSSVRSFESREKTHQWLTGDIIPCGTKNTKMVIVGNLLHEDSLLMKLKHSIENKWFNGVFREYPLLDKNNKPLWPGRFETKQDILELRKSIANEQSWQREYMLKIISDEDRVVRPEWIQYYDNIPEDEPHNRMRYAILAVDLAISEKDTADCTAILSAKVWGHGEDLRIYILPYPVNKRMSHPKTMDMIREISGKLRKDCRSKIIVEDVGYQKAVVERLKKENYPAEGVSVAGQDKKARLSLTTPTIQNGNVLFPKHGAENLISQLIGFGKERHDDLADAFSLLVNKVVSETRVNSKIQWPIVGSFGGPSILEMEF